MMLSTLNCADVKALQPLNSENTVLEVENLCVDFKVRGKIVHILSNISFNLSRGETLGIIGESGCGKSIRAGINAHGPLSSRLD